jgi:hypothetical protein
MKRISLLVILAILMVTSAGSQIRFGLRGGVNTAYFNARDVVVNDEILSTVNDATVGFHGGLMAQINFLGMFIQPELLFSSIGSELRVRELQNGTLDHIRSQDYNKLDFPVLVGKRFGPARLGIGPVGTIMLSTSSDLNELGYREKFNTATFGYQIGAGVDLFSRIALDLKYEGNLSRLGSGIVVGGVEREFDLRSRQLIVSVGIFF